MLTANAHAQAKSAVESTRPVRHVAFHGRHAVQFLISFLLVFLAVDQFLALQPLRELYGSRNYSLWKWKLLSSQSEGPDVVVLGSSYEAYGINPQVMDAAIRQALNVERTTLNLSASASSLLTQYLFVSRMLDAGHQPDVVLLGITPNAVDTGLASWLRNGLGALGAMDAVPLVFRHEPRFLDTAIPAALLKSYPRWHDFRICVQRLMLAAPINPRSGEIRHANGWAEWRGDTNPGHETLDDSVDVISGHDVVMQERMASSNINGVAVRRSIRMLREAGVEVLLIELPHSRFAPAYASPSKNRPYAEFVEQLRRETSVVVVRPPDGLLTDDDYWDGVHLSAEGAAKYSQWMASHVVRSIQRRESSEQLAVWKDEKGSSEEELVAVP
ncbi:MAG: hypothetical protein ACPGXK_00480 [Phycisphaerae bacterium]